MQLVFLNLSVCRIRNSYTGFRPCLIVNVAPLVAVITELGNLNILVKYEKYRRRDGTRFNK